MKKSTENLLARFQIAFNAKCPGMNINWQIDKDTIFSQPLTKAQADECASKLHQFLITKSEISQAQFGENVRIEMPISTLNKYYNAQLYQQKFIKKRILLEIEKAIKFIKIDQFHTGFPTYTAEGIIEVSIHQDESNRNLFRIDFELQNQDGYTILKKTTNASYEDIQNYAQAYDRNKEKIENTLRQREEMQQRQYYKKAG